MECRKCGVKGHTPKECRASVSAPYELKRTYTTFGITSTPIKERKQKVYEDEYEEKKGDLSVKYFIAKNYSQGPFNIEYAKKLFNSAELTSIDSKDTKRLREFFQKYYEVREHKEHLYISNGYNDDLDTGIPDDDDDDDYVSRDAEDEDENEDEDEDEDNKGDFAVEYFIAKNYDTCFNKTPKKTWSALAAKKKIETALPSAQAPAAQEVTPKKSWSALASKKLESAPPAPHKVKEVLLGIKTQPKSIPQPDLSNNDNQEQFEMPFDFQPVDENIYNKQEKRSGVEMCDDEY